jgi:hypothetical protein
LRFTIFVAASLCVFAGAVANAGAGAQHDLATGAGDSHATSVAFPAPRRLMAMTRGMSPPARQRQAAHQPALAVPGRGLAVSDIVIDVMVAYTGAAARHYADIEHELIDAAVEKGNDSFRLSNLGHIKLRLVHAYQTDYLEEGGHFAHVWRLADKGDGYMEEVHALRTEHHADVVVLIVDDAEGCGLATRVMADANEAFAVVHHACAVTNYSLAHEIGHLIGARHELGYTNGTKWRDIMSYKDTCGGCPRVPVWSGPMVFVKGERAGTAELNNASIIAQQAARVAAFM